ncbi:MAG: 50S ribosome-binding GTPase [Elainella sp. C42_A2020_010]|nr:50S ribosome-binding GTPase [Elainella sp. C42_A2020_010]
MPEPHNAEPNSQPHPDWKQQITSLLKDASSGLRKALPLEPMAKTITGWLSIDEAQVANILATVRAELPTTEALLIGKPQAGKSSIVRGLTGVSAEIVGQGFRPHTQHMQRYAYPSEDLPLLVFTDTVGLGDVTQETEAIIQELIGDLKQSSQRARVLILTVKINDFAVDTLRHIAQQLRRQYPQIPCLLAVTCLHEVYPSSTVDHPAYPPDLPDVERAFAAQQQAFAGLYDRAVLIDFTLEEDDYHPVFYGLEALRDNLAELLPEAEARAIHQLLDEGVGKQLGNLYRDVGRRYMTAFSVMAATLAAVPLPFATMPVLTALQVSMVGLLGKLYGQTLSPSQAGGIVSAIAGGFLAQAIGRELIKFLPGFGSVIAASWAAAYTWALGEAACVYFGDLLGGKNPDPQQIQQVMRESFQTAKERFKGIKR